MRLLKQLFKIKAFQYHSSLLLFALINVLFIYKYGQRIDEALSLIAVAGYIVFVLVLSYLFINNKLPSVSYKTSAWIVILYTLCCIIGFYLLPKESLDVDRWSIITAFWDYASGGRYPYYAQSFDGNYPGPMPFYFCLAWPFYLMGEIGLFSLAGVLILFYFLYKKKSKNELTYALFLTLTSVSIAWEVLARSALLINSVLLLIFIYYLCNIHIFSKKIFWVTAVMGGLLLSTRGIFSLVFLIWGVYVLKQKLISFPALLKWCIVFACSFAFTFLPLLLFYNDDFFRMNPFLIQSTFLLPFAYIPVFFLIATIFGLLCKRGTDVVYFSGLALFIPISFYFAYHSWQSGFEAAYINSIIDISYFLFSFPFLLFIVSSHLKPATNDQQ